ncbi:putative GTPase HflX [Forsythia ovata]|uniref:GTPase HflX n=1 Tax=Forsythia ovata TaxID=205694 RepID=A0ABD1UWE9_9LAMI
MAEERLRHIADSRDGRRVAMPNPRTKIGSGKVAEIKSAIHEFDVETIIFDDKLSLGKCMFVDLQDMNQARQFPGTYLGMVEKLDHLTNAKRGGYAIGAFNVYNSVGIEALVAAAEEEQSPAILQV